MGILWAPAFLPAAAGNEVPEPVLEPVAGPLKQNGTMEEWSQFCGMGKDHAEFRAERVVSCGGRESVSFAEAAIQESRLRVVAIIA